MAVGSAANRPKISFRPNVRAPNQKLFAHLTCRAKQEHSDIIAGIIQPRRKIDSALFIFLNLSEETVSNYRTCFVAFSVIR
jgi:hypothetical protein